MALKLIQVTGSEPVTLSEAKEVCGVDADITSHDNMITRMMKGARSQCEHLLGRVIVDQQFERSLDAFPDGGLMLAWPYVSTIDSVVYVDADNVLQTWSNTNYALDNRELPGWVLPAVDVEWPDTLDTANAVRVLFTSTWGEATVPQDVCDWILMKTATLYKFREQISAGTFTMTLSHGDGLLDRWKVWA
jgi:uncharacterized phiE125 gp8 family phage protein